MLRGVACGARSTERPGYDANLVHVAECSNIIDDRANIIPIGRNRGHLVRIARRTLHRYQVRNERGLLFACKVTWIVHWRGPRRPSVTGHIHCEYVESRPS